VSETAPSDDIRTEHEIQRVRRIWAFSRDQGDWAALAACFHPDAMVNISWYCGPASGFIAQARESATRQRPGESSRHWLGNFRAVVHGTRATLESDVQILTRDLLDGHLVDCTSFGRFFDLFEKRDGVWRISKWTAIYEKDRIDPVFPPALPPTFFDRVDLATRNGNGAFMRLRVTLKGRTVPDSMVLGGSDAETQVRREGAGWLLRR
jgi:hypothetical protein